MLHMWRYQDVLLEAGVVHGPVLLHDLLQVHLRAAHQHPDQRVVTCAVTLGERSGGFYGLQTTSLTFDLTSDQEKLPRNKKIKLLNREETFRRATEEDPSPG